MALRSSEDQETPGNQPSSPSFGPDELRDQEKSSVGQPAGSSTTPGNVNFHTGAPRTGSGGNMGTSTSGDNVNYSSGEVPQAEQSLYNSSATAPGHIKFRDLLSTRRRKAAFGGGLLGTIIGLVFFFTVSSGPLQLIHLSHILQNGLGGSQHTLGIRSKGLFRYARSGDIGETRLGKLGSVVYNKTLNQLKDQGITFERNANGTPKSMTVETLKNDNYKELKLSQRKAAIARDFNVSEDLVTSAKGKGVFTINLDNTSFKGISFARATAKTAIGSLNNNAAETALAGRFLTRAWDLPSLWSPASVGKSIIKNKGLSSAEQAKAAKSAETERLRALENAPGKAIGGTAAMASVKNAIEANKSTITKALIATAALCAVRNAANAAVVANRAAIVLPAAAQAADKISFGSKVESGKNVTVLDVGAAVDSLKDPQTGLTVWDSQAMQALSGNPKPGGEGLPLEYAPAFSGKTTAENIRNAINVNVAGFVPTQIACSKAGLVITAVAGASLLLLSIPTEGASTAVYAGWVASNAVSAVALGGLFYEFDKHFENFIKEKVIVPDVLSGSLGGSLLAYGSKALGNSVAISMGGTELSPTQAGLINSEFQNQNLADFNSRSLAYKLFNPNDYRTPVGKLYDAASQSFTQNMAKMGSAIFNVGHIFSAIGSMFAPKVQAASTYNWVIPQYGTPDSLALNPNYQDPYANADAVAKLLDGPNGASLVSRAKACFGVDITNKDGDGKWQAVAASDVNPGTDDYAKGNCNDTSDAWNRIRLFIIDSRAMDSIACYTGADDQACSNVYGGGSTTPASTDTLNSQQLAQQILNNPNIDLTSFSSSVKDDVQAAADGKPGTSGVMTSSAILQLINTVGQNHKVLITAIQSNGQGHCGGAPKAACPSDPHYNGDGVDFGSLDGQSLTGRDSGSMAIIKIAEGLLPQGSRFGQKNCNGSADLTLPAGFTEIADSCNHLHIDVPLKTP